MKILVTFTSLLIALQSLAASSILIDDFDSYESTAALQSNWSSFGFAATAGPPSLHVGEGVDGSNAARFALDWRGAPNDNANARRRNLSEDLTGFDAISVVAFIQVRAGFAPPPAPTVFKVAIQGANGDIWQTPSSTAPTIESGSYETYTFLLSDMELVVGGGSLNEALQNSSEIRLRFENAPGVESRQDVFFDSVSAITLETGGEEGALPDVRIATAVEVHFDTVDGQTYQVQRSSDLVDWANEGDLIVGTGVEVSRLFSTRQDPSRGFFRVMTTNP